MLSKIHQVSMFQNEFYDKMVSWSKVLENEIQLKYFSIFIVLTTEAQRSTAVKNTFEFVLTCIQKIHLTRITFYHEAPSNRL
jgi:hypothetical protein